MNSKKIIIAIDGFSSCGKSTLAKALANHLQYVFIDTGAMYRAIALFFLRENVNFNNLQEVNSSLKKMNLQFKYNPNSLQSDMYLNDENVEMEIREMRVSNKVSEVAAISEVRDFAVAQQKEMGKYKGIVMDGRDIGTVVFPNAELKIFVTADADIRIQRRFLELGAKNAHITKEEISENLQHRDLLDSTRAISPLKQADDALVLDNTKIGKQAQLELALNWAHERITLANLP